MCLETQLSSYNDYLYFHQLLSLERQRPRSSSAHDTRLTYKKEDHKQRNEKKLADLHRVFFVEMSCEDGEWNVDENKGKDC